MQEPLHAYVECYHVILWRWDCTIWEKVPRKRNRAGDIGDQNRSQVDSGDDADLDAVALGDNALCYVDFERDDDDCILAG